MEYTESQRKVALISLSLFIEQTNHEELEGTTKDIRKQAEAFNDILDEFITNVKNL